MIEFDPALSAALDRFQPRASVRADWADVLARDRRRRVYRAGVVGALATAGVLALAAPPLSLGERLFVTENDEPAPERVIEHFRWGNDARRQRPEVIKWDRPPSDLPHVRAEETRSVVTLHTDRGEAILWAAPADDGRRCFVVQRTWETDAAEGPLESACTSHPARPLEIHDVSSVRRRGDWLVAGVVREGLDVEVHAGGDRLRARVVDGFFLAELPDYASAVDVVASADDEVVARDRLERPPSKALIDRPPLQTYRLATIVDVAPGVPFGFGVATTPKTVCLGFFLGKEQQAFLGRRVGLQGGCGLPPGGREVDWDIQEEVVNEAPDYRPTPVAVLYGVATRRVDALEVRYEDGKRQAVDLHPKPLGAFDRYFVFSIPSDHFRRGHVPSTLIARDARGRVVFADRLG